MRQTKIVATLGPVSDSLENLEKLVDAGANVFRLNFSHGTHESHGRVIDRIRKISKKLGREFPIILDTKGPEIRTADLKKPIVWKKNSKIILTVEHAPYEKSGKIQINYDAFVSDVLVGDKIIVDNGSMELEVLEKKESDVICKVLSGGTLGSRRHLNLPGKNVSLDSITKKDWVDIEFGVKKKVDFIALSFVRSAVDVESVKNFLKKKKSQIDVMAKIETAEAVRNLEEIISASHEVMVARGDLGVEIPFFKVPQTQRDIVRLCAKYQKSVIVATHMLESMIDHPIPTRAEISDVAAAAFQRADATMLSGETAIGKFPFKSVRAMGEIAHETEKNFMQSREIRDLQAFSDRGGLSKIVAQLPEELADIAAILVVSGSGSTARLVSSFRPRVPIFSFTNCVHSQRKMQLLWGVDAMHIRFSNQPEKTVDAARKALLKKYPDFVGEKIVLISGFLVGKGFCPTVQIRKL
ncbi:pyruvate kinase [bacterium]|jgi:pyruvate kinase|nr:pyruvate kinase [bacterium]MBT6831875.1 pyruvate kinase [bacterium]MBT6995965.1 pyruvate kinase [bacterium]MBT7772240.1 pyruvate kinase [bacterium]